MMNTILAEDIKNLSESSIIENCIGKSVLITGATGLIGSLLVKAIAGKSCTIYAACRSRSRFEAVFGKNPPANIIPLFSDIKELDISGIEVDYIIHGAGTTDSKTFVDKPVDTIETILFGTENLLRQCREKAIKGFVFLSSLEVYGQFDSSVGIRVVRESDSGFTDPMSVRSSYPESKRMAETLCKAYAVQFGIPVKVARLCQTFGAGVSYNDNRVFAQFARSVIEKKDIVLRTKGETVRNYCYTADAAEGILTVLFRGNAGEAYNIANSTTAVSIAELAELFCRQDPTSSVKVIFDLAEDVTKLGYNPVLKVVLDTSKLEELGWRAKTDMNGMISRLIESMKHD